MLEIIEDADSPDSFEYRIDLGSARRITTDGAGGHNVLDGVGEVVSLGAPWAYDANGQPVPVQYTLHDEVLTM